MAPDDDREAPDDHVGDDAGQQRAPDGVEELLVADEVERQDEDEDDQRRRGCGRGGCRPWRADAAAIETTSSALRRPSPASPCPCPSPWPSASGGSERLDLAVADVAHQTILVGAGRRCQSECPSGPPPHRRARRGRARSAAARRAASSSMRTSMPSGRLPLVGDPHAAPETSSVVVSPPIVSSTPCTVTSQVRGDADELAALDALDVAAEARSSASRRARRRACR